MTPPIEIQEIDDATCDVCARRWCRVVLITLSRVESIVLCHRCRKRLAAMLLDRAPWFKPPPLKAGNETATLLSAIQKRWDALKTSAGLRLKTWERICGSVPYLSPEADPAVLADLLRELGA